MPLPNRSADMGGYTYEWTSKIQKYLPTEVAEAIKAMPAGLGRGSGP